jgi:hypothetical protein
MPWDTLLRPATLSMFEASSKFLDLERWIGQMENVMAVGADDPHIVERCVTNGSLTQGMKVVNETDVLRQVAVELLKMESTTVATQPMDALGFDAKGTISSGLEGVNQSTFALPESSFSLLVNQVTPEEFA